MPSLTIFEHADLRRDGVYRPRAMEGAALAQQEVTIGAVPALSEGFSEHAHFICIEADAFAIVSVGPAPAVTDAFAFLLPAHEARVLHISPGYKVAVISAAALARAPSSATIANGENLSGAVDLGDKTMTGIIMPAAWTAAVLTFAVSADGVTYNPLYDEYGTEVAETVAAGRAIRLDPAQWAGWRYLKIRSGTAAAPVAQGAERIVQIVSRAV